MAECRCLSPLHPVGVYGFAIGCNKKSPLVDRHKVYGLIEIAISNWFVINIAVTRLLRASTFYCCTIRFLYPQAPFAKMCSKHFLFRFSGLCISKLALNENLNRQTHTTFGIAIGKQKTEKKTYTKWINGKYSRNMKLKMSVCWNTYYENGVGKWEDV